jgi:hypothetical protein
VPSVRIVGNPEVIHLDKSGLPTGFFSGVLVKQLRQRAKPSRHPAAAVRIVAVAALQHRDQHCQETVRNPAERTSVGVACLAKAGVLLLTPRVMLHAEASPTVHGVSEPLVAAVTHPDLYTFAALFRHRRRSAVRRESVLITLRQ